MQAWQSGINGTGLWAALEQGFNYMASAGYSSAAGKGSAQLPILIGELGSTLQGFQVMQLSALVALQALTSVVGSARGWTTSSTVLQLLTFYSQNSSK